jgi:endonuclease YncB( thermonuclease family)
MKYFACIGFVLSVVWGVSAQADTTGTVCVINGDMISIDGVRFGNECKDGTVVRLHGIDAPELEQKCRNDEGAIFKCGLYAASFLLEFVKGKIVKCHGNSQDADGNWLMRCYVDGENINAHMVREGWALSYEMLSRRYQPDEVEAKKAKNGIWAFEFIKPWDWRKGIRLDGMAE